MDGIVQELVSELIELEKIENQARSLLKNAPEGNLVVCKNHNSNQYYFRENNSSTTKYMSKQNMDIIYELARKEYNIKVLKVIESQKKAINNFIKKYDKDAVEKVYGKMTTGRKKLINPYRIPIDEYSSIWLERKTKEKEILLRGSRWKFDIRDDDVAKIITENGEVVRSKSEKILADKLYSMGIPYVYELPLEIGGKWIRPDFTILSLKNRGEYYWEHWGMMDDPVYAEKAIFKKELYQENGIYHGEGLIETYETQKHPINIKVVEDFINKYLI